MFMNRALADTTSRLAIAAENPNPPG
jgi:hypothetical protein